MLLETALEALESSLESSGGVLDVISDANNASDVLEGGYFEPEMSDGSQYEEEKDPWNPPPWAMVTGSVIVGLGIIYLISKEFYEDR